ncbi:hypothetical protein [Acaryochloris sp. CCMEE 5410]|uniref:hypothetical protein n=1 Tax=Acaryochloris sp. CCMEE 5410 TaxID=310037 RepID=UPI0002484D46|nr:hypothetical protein [Acaryochloris sp. CCMEE 5410]KAI9130644.1 hypothetical protein ON05_022980 [Acaryochloris sp. CCMEE 5410]
MNWINELDKHSDNAIIKALVGHLKQERYPTAIIKWSTQNKLGVEFKFESVEPHFLNILPDALESSWQEAQPITAKYIQLVDLVYVDDASLPFNPDYGVPFDPNEGIWFSFGRVYSNPEQQRDSFESTISYQLPTDFVEMIGRTCEGGFSDYYQVYRENDRAVMWVHLLLMKIADEHDHLEHDVLRLLQEKPNLFGNIGNLEFFPFGEAWIVNNSTDEVEGGYLVFDIGRNNAVVCFSESGELHIDIADSFRQMMLSSLCLFLG